MTEKQLKGLLDHTDSPFIRAIGFLYIRYCVDPKTLWERFEPYLDDPEEIRIRWGEKSPCTTIGLFVCALLQDIKYYGTLLPRLPVLIQREIDEKLRNHRRSLFSKRKSCSPTSSDHRSKSRKSASEPESWKRSPKRSHRDDFDMPVYRNDYGRDEKNVRRPQLYHRESSFQSRSAYSPKKRNGERRDESRRY